MQIDVTKTVLQNLLNLILASNPGFDNTTTDVTAGIPSTTTVAGQPVINTAVQIQGTIANGAAGYRGAQTINYGRLSLAAEAANPATPADAPAGAGAADAAAVLEAVATHYGFVLSEISWVSYAAPDAGVRPTATTLQIQSAGSLLYLDGTADVQINWAS